MTSKCSREAQDAHVSDHKHREQRTFCAWHHDLITCEAGEAIRTSRGSRLCSYAKISLYPVHAACSTDHRGTRISSFRTEFFAPAPPSMTSGSMPKQTTFEKEIFLTEIFREIRGSRREISIQKYTADRQELSA